MIFDYLKQRIYSINEKIKELKQPMWGIHDDCEIERRQYDLDAAYATKRLLSDIWFNLKEAMVREETRYKG